MLEAVVGLLGFLTLLQGLFPTTLQLSGKQAVLWINRRVLSIGQITLIVNSCQPMLPLLIGFAAMAGLLMLGSLEWSLRKDSPNDMPRGRTKTVIGAAATVAAAAHCAVSADVSGAALLGPRA